MQTPEAMPGIGQLSIGRKISNAVFFIGYLKPVIWILILVVIINLVSASSLVPIMDFGRVLTDYFGKRESSVWTFLGLFTSPQRAIYLYVVLAALLIVVSGAVTLISHYLGSYVREFMLRNLRLDIYKSLEHLNMQSVNRRGAGDYVQGIHRDVYAVDQLFSELFNRTLPQAIFACVAFAVLLNINWVMTLALFGAGFVLFPIFAVCNVKVNRLSGWLRHAFTEMSDQLIETIGGFRDIVAGGRFDRFAARFDDTLKRSQGSAVSIAWWGQVGGMTTTSLTSLFTSVPIVVAIPQLLRAHGAGQLTTVATLIGATISYVLFLQQFLQIYSVVYNFLQQAALTSPSFQSLRMMLTPEPGRFEQADLPEAQAPPLHLSPVRSIQFEGVSMRFNGRTLFDGLKFSIPGGKISAIVGQSGSGKTTIFNLLLRLLDPTNGKILINGRLLEGIGEKQLKKIMGLIPQDPFIFNCSLRENLLMASADSVDDNLLNRAVDLAQLRELVESREGGLDFVAGHMGRNLSAGEKQRLALARLIVQDPEIIICDEYTANIDVKTAGLIHEVMRTEFAGRTRIIITHQLYTIKGADHIVVLDKGTVVQAGTHEELVARPGVYRDLWDLQKLT
ncbi:MAG TPA: ABC transporter ATP-binding protein [Syntrophobacteraceae bacterium]|nr:ABC transporter ATP-binding protein [Syntrophobacteraceae bacterium]